ncbi:hypothetical protein LCGC14_0504730 [marine sediment metagenome]|uniref:Uncharacterized protein n=1 Tax=marine sediment metagenome TaxID=412755 RepID=A0A0F9S2T5_9ZZZZ
MAAIIKGILGLPGWIDIAFAAALSLIVLFMTGLMTRFFPGTVFTELIASFTSLFLIFISLAAIFGFVAGEVIINIFVGPVWELLLNFVAIIVNIVPNALTHFFTGRQSSSFVYQFTPVSLLPFAQTFVGMLIQVSGVTSTSIGDLLLGSSGVGVIGALSGQLGSQATNGGE